MEIIATTTDGVLISASKNEVNEILNAVNGTKPEALKIGMKIPAIDYASTITKIKTLATCDNVKYLYSRIDSFNETVIKLKEALDSTKNVGEDI